MNTKKISNSSISIWAAKFKSNIVPNASIKDIKQNLKLAAEQHKFSLYFKNSKNYGFKFLFEPREMLSHKFGVFKFDLNFYRAIETKRILCYTYKNNTNLDKYKRYKCKNKRPRSYHQHIYRHGDCNKYADDRISNRISVCLGEYSEEIRIFCNLLDFGYCVQLVKDCHDKALTTDGIDLSYRLRLYELDRSNYEHYGRR